MKLLVATGFVILGVLPVAAQPPADLIRFNCRLADLQSVGGHWFLVAGNVRIKDLGISEPDAREVLRLIRDLGLNQYGTVGKPRPILEYWLADGHAPRGSTASRRLTAFDPETLRAEVAAGRWCLRDDRQILFTFGFSADDARQALAVLRQYGFNRVGYVGEPAPAMMFFLSCPEQPFGPQASAPANTLFGAAMPEPTGQPAGVTDLAQLGASSASESSIVRATMPPPVTLASCEPASRAVAPVEGVAMDWRDASLEHGPDDWRLMSGGRCLAHFGGNEQPAREVLRLVQDYRCTEFCRVGRSEAVLSYFLADGHAPRGPAFGFQSVAFCPEALNVQQLAGGWIICAANEPLLACGTSFDDAAEALQALQRHQFDHLIRVNGAEATGLHFFVKER